MRQFRTINKVKNNARLSKGRFDRRYMENEQDSRRQDMLERQFSLSDYFKSKRIGNKYKNRRQLMVNIWIWHQNMRDSRDTIMEEKWK